MKTVAIVGSHPATRSDVDWLAPDDVWVFNEAAQSQWCGRVTGVFQLHDRAVYRNPHNLTNHAHWEWLQRPHDFPIYMKEHDPDVPACEVYPLEDVLDLLSSVRLFGDPLRYCTSTLEYAIGLALVKGYNRILVYGAEMDSNTEYAYQREGVAFWLGLAAGMGVSVELRCMRRFFDRPLYAYAGAVVHTREMFRGRIEEHKAAMDAVQKLLAPLDLSGDVNTQLDALDSLTMALAQAEGAKDEALKYEYKVKEMEAANGMAVLDRFEFEYSGAALKDSVAGCGASATRTRGWVDAALSVWEQTRSDEAQAALVQNIAAHNDAQYEYGRRLGAFEENLFYQRRWDRLLEAAGGEKTLEAYK